MSGLWIRRLAALSLLAALAAALACYHVSLAPPALKPRGLEFATAKAQVQVDTPVPVLVDEGQDGPRPATLARTYALYLKTAGAQQAIAAALGVAPDRVAASGPFTTLLDRTNLAGGSLPQPPAPSSRSYRLLVDVAEEQPIVTLYGQAPTVAEAKTIVLAATRVLHDAVAHQQQTFPLAGDSRAVLRDLGPVTGGTVNPGARMQLAIFVFALVLAGGAALLAWRDRRRRRPPAPVAVATADDAEFDDPDAWPNTTRLMPWALAAFIVMLMCVPFDAISTPGGGKLDRPMLMLLLGLWLVSLLALRGPARPSLRLTRIHVAGCVFFAICCLSVATNTQDLVMLDELGLSIKKLLLLATYLLFFFIAASTIRPREVPRFATLVLGLALVVAAGSILEYRFQFNPFYQWWGKILPVTPPSDMFQRDSIGRISVYGPTGQPLELAGMLIIALPFALVRLLDAPDRRRRILYSLATGLLLAGAVATFRKTSFIGPVIAVGVVAAYWPKMLVRRLLPLGALLLVMVHFGSPGAIGSIAGQLDPTRFNSVLSTKDRTSDYDAVRPDVSAHLLLGRGYQSYDPHKYRILDNEYLSLLIGTGLLGVLGYLLLLGSAMTLAHPVIRGPDRRRGPPALAASAAVAVTVGLTLLFDALSFPRVPYMVLLMAAFIVALHRPAKTTVPVRATLPPLDPVPPVHTLELELDHEPVVERELEPVGAS